MSIPTSLRTLAAVLGFVGLLGACGSSTSNSSPPTRGTSTTASSTTASITSNAELCSARASLKSSLEDLANVDVVKNGTSSVDAALTKVRDDLKAVRSAAQGQLNPQVDGLQNAIDQLGKSISNLTSGGGISDVITAAKNVGQAGSNLTDALSNLKCP
jgi:capsule polysaccharide export protein KpsE/RkpR